jgi:hypothetical protein
LVFLSTHTLAVEDWRTAWRTAWRARVRDGCMAVEGDVVGGLVGGCGNKHGWPKKA